MISVEGKGEVANSARAFLGFLSMIFLIASITLAWKVGGWKLGVAMILYTFAMHLEIGISVERVHDKLLRTIDRIVG